MSKFTFVCQEESTPLSRIVETKRTVEFRADGLSDVLQEFEHFLRGAGFHFDGYLDIVSEEDFQSEDDEETEGKLSSIDWTVSQLMKGPITLQDVTKEEGFFIQPHPNDSGIDLSNYGAAQPTISVGGGVDTITLSDLHRDFCQVCGLQKSVMKAHNCYDSNCPKETW